MYNACYNDLALTAHNEKRRLHDSEDLEIDPQMSYYIQLKLDEGFADDAAWQAFAPTVADTAVTPNTPDYSAAGGKCVQNKFKTTEI